MTQAATLTRPQTNIRPAPCVTQDPNEADFAGPEFLAVCLKVGDQIAMSVYCPVTCVGHPICRPCLDLASAKGILKP